MSAVAASKPPPRGTFVVFEGVDRAGKSTQCKLLAEGLRKRGREATLINFPDRTTGVGQLIDKYLRKEVELDDRAVHLMFSANRWEAAQSIKDLLASGVDVWAPIFDRKFGLKARRIAAAISSGTGAS